MFFHTILLITSCDLRVRYSLTMSVFLRNLLADFITYARKKFGLVLVIKQIFILTVIYVCICLNRLAHHLGVLFCFLGIFLFLNLV